MPFKLSVGNWSENLKSFNLRRLWIILYGNTKQSQLQYVTDSNVKSRKHVLCQARKMKCQKGWRGKPSKILALS